jgi:hypothetical protein
MGAVEIEVRCCCSPQKLLGFLLVNEQFAKSGLVVECPDGRRFPADKITRIADGNKAFSYVALKSEHSTVDELAESMPGFRAAEAHEIERDALWPNGLHDYRPHGCLEREVVPPKFEALLLK